MITSMRFIPKIVLLLLLNLPIFSQQILDEMEIDDISDSPEIQRIINREPDQGLLVVSSQLPSLEFSSNNTIFKTEEIEPGKWYLYVTPGTHIISFQAKGVISQRQRFFFEPKSVKGVKVRIIASTSVVLDIQSDPENAQVYLNGEFYGTTPFVGKLLSRRYTLELKKDRYLSHTEEVILLPGENTEIRATLERDPNAKFTMLVIKSDPAGAAVLLDGNAAGQTPLTLPDISPGTHTIEITADQHQPYRQTLRLVDGESRELAVDLKRIFSLSIASAPASAAVFINGQTEGNTPFTRQVIEGDRLNIRLQLSGYQDWQRTITVRQDETLQAAMQPVPIAEDKKSSSKTWLWIAGSGAVLGGAVVFLLSGSSSTPPPNGPESLPEPGAIWPPQ